MEICSNLYLNTSVLNLINEADIIIADIAISRGKQNQLGLWSVLVQLRFTTISDCRLKFFASYVSDLRR